MYSQCKYWTFNCFSLTATAQPTHTAKGIMNRAFDRPDRPQTPSFVGSYSSFHDSQPEAPYGKETERRTTIMSTSASTVGFIPSEKKKQKNKCGRICVVILLACFIVLSIVMIVLYLTRPFKTRQENASVNHDGTSQKTVSITDLGPAER